MTAEQLAARVERAVPGSVQAHADDLDMPSLTIAGERLIAACTYLRDQQGKNFLSAVSAVDYLGYGEEVAGYSAASAAATSTARAAGARPRR